VFLEDAMPSQRWLDREELRKKQNGAVYLYAPFFTYAPNPINTQEESHSLFVIENLNPRLPLDNIPPMSSI
jgi:hypothetical protein